MSEFTVLANRVPELSNPEYLNTVKIYVPSKSLEEYKNAEGWKLCNDNIWGIGTKVDYNINVNALPTMSAIHLKIGEDNLENVYSLKVTGTINSYDIMIMRNKMPGLKVLDLSDADIVDCDYEYYTGYHSVANTFTGYAVNPGLKELKLPKSLEAIGDYAMQIGTDENYSAPSLSSVTIYNNVKTIGRDAFKSTQLTSISIPASVNSISEGAFDYCKSLRTAIFEDGTEPISLKNAFACNYKMYLENLYLGRNVLENRHPEFGWLEYYAIGPSDLYDFDQSLNTLELGETVTYLPEGLFRVC